MKMAELTSLDDVFRVKLDVGDGMQRQIVMHLIAHDMDTQAARPTIETGQKTKKRALRRVF